MRFFKNKKKLLGIIVLCVMGCVAITPTPEDTTNDTKTVEVEKLEPVNGKYSDKIATLKQEVHNGKFTFDTGDSYDGKWSKKTIQGKGTYTYKDLGTYEGNFKKGQRSGEGTFTWNDNSKYVGKWKKDKINGEGIYTYSDGGYLSGKFKNNQFYEGKYTITVNDVTYKYKISNGTLSTSIEIAYKDHGSYKGSYEGNKITGFGIFTYSNTDRYTGNLTDGKKQGSGTYTWASGSKYSGQWDQDMMSGQGTYYYSNDEKSTLEGTFSNNAPQGECIYKKSSTEKYKTYWENGNCVKVEGYKDE